MDGWVLVGRMVVRVLFVFSEACFEACWNKAGDILYLYLSDIVGSDCK